MIIAMTKATRKSQCWSGLVESFGLSVKAWGLLSNLRDIFCSLGLRESLFSGEAWWDFVWQRNTNNNPGHWGLVLRSELPCLKPRGAAQLPK